MKMLTGSFPWKDNHWLKNKEACKTVGYAFAILKINETAEEEKGFCIGRILEEI